MDDLEDHIRQAIANDDWATATRLGDQLDRRHRRTAPTLAGSALWYAARGHKVFPLRPGSKKPHPGTHGCLDATTDADQIRRWWQATPEANIGLATGHTVDVIDIDGPAGVRSKLDHDDLFDMPFLGLANTPRPGGTHIYVPAADGMGNKTGLLPGIDYRGEGGYVVAPPSRVTSADDPDIKHDGTYDWLAPIGVDHTQCRLHGDTLRPDACWTCQQISRGTDG